MLKGNEHISGEERKLIPVSTVFCIRDRMKYKEVGWETKIEVAYADYVTNDNIYMTIFSATSVSFIITSIHLNRLCGLVVRVLSYRSGGPGSIPGTTKKKVVGMERGPLSLVSTIEELLDRKVAAPV
jgi:hypothetical protein